MSELVVRASTADDVGEIARIGIGQLEIRHCRGHGISVRILQPCVSPLARSLIGDVRERGWVIRRFHGAAVGQFNGVAVHAPVATQEIAAEVQLRCARQGSAMALPAGSFEIACGKNRFFPCASGVVRFRNFCGRTLSAMADYAAPVFDVVSYRRMGAKRFGDRSVAQEAFLADSHMARGAAIDDREFGQPDLLNSSGEMMLQGEAVRTSRNEFAVVPLIMPPLIKEIFGRRYGKRDQQQKACPSETMNWRSEDMPAQPFAHRVRDQGFLQGQTQTQPGPRKSAPTVVRIAASIRNQVMIQKESGLALNQF